MTHPVHSALAQAAAEGIDRQLALERDTTVLHELTTLATRAESRGFEPVERRGIETIVELGRVHIARSGVRRRPEFARQRAAAFHVVVERVVKQRTARRSVLPIARD